MLTIHKASAGSGKTFSLALEYIRLILGYADPHTGQRKLYFPHQPYAHRQILAITFTNKATEEMKQRIISELEALSDTNAKSNYRDILTKEYSVSAQTLALAANAALNAILHDYGHFNISTIDAFFQSILRSFAYEAELSGNYSLEIDNEAVYSQAISELTDIVVGKASAPAAKRDALTKWLKSYMLALFNNGSSFDILNPNNAERKTLLDFVHKLSDETYQANRTEIDAFAAIPNSISNLQAKLQAKLKPILQELLQVTVELQKQNLAKRPLNFVNRICENPPVDDKFELDKFKTWFDFLNWDTDAAEFFFTKVATPEQKELADRFQQLFQIYFTIHAMLANMYRFGLFSEITNTAQKNLVEENAIVLSDTNVLLQKIIGDSDTPFIYEKTGRQLKHFLIDEFQDTSLLQWNNIKPLLSESLSEGHENMIIGDVKQCIYRFRNSDPRLLDTIVESDPKFNSLIEHDPAGGTVNYRSSKAVVDFNNAMFEYLAAATGNERVYARVAQKAKAAERPGYVKLYNFAEKLTPWDAMIAEIKRQLTPEEEEGGGGYQPSDIVILTRTNPGAAEVVQQLLTQTGAGGPLQGVTILSDEALYVSNSIVVQHLVRQLRRLTEPAPKSRETTDKKKRQYTSELELDQLNERLRQLAAQGVESGEALRQVIDEFHNGKGLFVTNPDTGLHAQLIRNARALPELVEWILNSFPQKEILTKEAQYIFAFQDLITDYSQRGAPTISGFLELWDEKYSRTASIGISSQANAIRVMTIHKSKGLEFPCVHLYGLPSTLNRETVSRWYAAREIFEALQLDCDTPEFFPITSASTLSRTLFKEEYMKYVTSGILDELNVLYVAFTRAEAELVIYNMAKEKAAEPKTYTLLAGGAQNILVNGTTPMTFKEQNAEYGAPTRRSETIKPDDDEEHIEVKHINGYAISTHADPWSSTIIDEEAAK